jgi:hypothetical protein
VRNPEWRRQMGHCRHSFPDLQWHSDAWSGGPPHVWLQGTRVMLNRIRSAIRKEQRRMLRDPPSTFFFLTVMAMIFHKTKLQQKLSKSLSHAASSRSMQSKFGTPKKSNRTVAWVAMNG